MAVDEQKLQHLLEAVDDAQARCVNCGLCLGACETFVETGFEHDSPRGRIDLARALMAGKVLPSSTAMQTFDACTDCGACEAVCPTNVQYQTLKGAVQEIRVRLQHEL